METAQRPFIQGDNWRWKFQQFEEQQMEEGVGEMEEVVEEIPSGSADHDWRWENESATEQTPEEPDPFYRGVNKWQEAVANESLTYPASTGAH